MKKVLRDNNTSNDKQENQTLPPLNKGNINSKNTPVRRRTSTGISTCNHPPPTLASTQNKNERRKVASSTAHPSVADPLVDPDRAEKVSAVARTVPSRTGQGVYTLYSGREPPSIFPAHDRLKKTKVKIGSEQRDV